MKSNNPNSFGTAKATEKIGISSERLRYWEQQGIVNPEYIQCGIRRFRQYSSEDIRRASLVKELVDIEKYTLEGAIRKLNRSDDGEEDLMTIYLNL